MKYPVIGEEINYMRATMSGEIFQGVGIAKAIFLDPRNRLMVGIVDTQSGDNWNIDLIGVNPSKATITAYEVIMGQVKDISEEGNKLVTETVAVYNDKVEALYTELLGAPVDFVEPEKVEKE
tara:strand:+ start:2167 stop:2532 length:366 start_codon:yes stop_codon:yes gene_type:complete